MPGFFERATARVTHMIAAALLVAAAAPALAEAPRFDLPIACTLGVDCFVQNHVDADPGPRAADFGCLQRTYDGHKGIDIRIPDDAAMRHGVAVLAAADGTVLRLRDGMDDSSVRNGGKPDIEGRECGNGLVIDHGEGWTTQYCHLKKDSIVVEPGDKVARGAKLGEVGLSGRTAFPHVHLGIRKDDAIIDPMTGAATASGSRCGVERHPLWSPAVDSAIARQDVSLLNAGFAAGAVSMKAIDEGSAAISAGSTDMPALVFYARVTWLRAGDVMALTLDGPDGREIVADVAERVSRLKAQMMRFAGKRRPAQGWEPGRYTARLRVLRGADTVLETEHGIELR